MFMFCLIGLCQCMYGGPMSSLSICLCTCLCVSTYVSLANEPNELEWSKQSFEFLNFSLVSKLLQLVSVWSLVMRSHALLIKASPKLLNLFVCSKENATLVDTRGIPSKLPYPLHLCIEKQNKWNSRKLCQFLSHDHGNFSWFLIYFVLVVKTLKQSVIEQCTHLVVQYNYIY